MSLRIETISPDQAQELLKHNTANRTVRPTRVRKYANEMRGGHWRLTGDPIRIDEAGNLLDGQHRLLASIEAGTSFKTAVFYGASPDIYPYLDVGLHRNPGDIFGHAGFTSTRDIAAITRGVLGWRKGILHDNRRMSEAILMDDMLAFAQKHETSLVEATRAAQRLYKSLRGSRSGWGVIAFETCELDDDLGAEFLDTVASGVGLAERDPRLNLRNWVVNRATSGRTIEQVVLVYTAARAWNYWINGVEKSNVKPWVRGSAPIRCECP